MAKAVEERRANARRGGSRKQGREGVAAARLPEPRGTHWRSRSCPPSHGAWLRPSQARRPTCRSRRVACWGGRAEGTREGGEEREWRQTEEGVAPAGWTWRVEVRR
jgi:hypothetical protein